MNEEEKNISDDMSSLIHAAEEWANELKQTEMIDSNNLDDSDSYPIYVPIEEVARQVALELCKTYNWNSEIVADNRCQEGNAGDITTSIYHHHHHHHHLHHHQPSEVSTTLHNTPQNPILSSIKLSESNFTESSTILSSTEHIEYQQQEALFDASQPLATIYEDTVDKTFTVTGNTSLNITEESDISDQVTYDNNTINKTFVVRRNTLPNMSKKLDINKTFIVRRNTVSNISKEFDTPDQIINDNSKQMFTVSQETTLPVMDTIHSFGEDFSYSSKTLTLQNPEKSTYLLSDDNNSDIFDKNRISQLKECSEGTLRKFHFTVPEISLVNPTPDTTYSSTTIDHHQKFPDNNHLVNSIPLIKSLNETQEIPRMLIDLNQNPELKNVNCQSNFFLAENIARNSCGAIISNTNSAIKDEVIILSPNETIAETNILTINGIIPSTFSKTSMNDEDMRSMKLPENIANLPTNNNISAVKSIIENEKNLPMIKLSQSNISRNNTSYRRLSKISRNNTSYRRLSKISRNNTSYRRLSKIK